MDRRLFHSQLQEITRRYGSARDRYERAMQRGRPAEADDAFGEMQEIEQSVRIISRPQK